MLGYRRRNRPTGNDEVKAGGMHEQELVLRLKKDELFDSHILLPHSEVNSVIYDRVNQFVEKYSGKTMTLTIMSDMVTEPVQRIFEEAYRMHYEDEYQKVAHYLKRRYVRAAMLLAVSVIAFWCNGFFEGFSQRPQYLVNILSQVSVFCLWEIGYTHFTRSDAAAERDRIVRARDAVIQFHCRPDKSTK